MSRHQRGMLLIAAVVLILLAAVMAAALVSLTTGGVQSGVQVLTGTQALSLAESGIEKGILQWEGNPAYLGEGPDPLANGSYVITTYGTDFSGQTLPANERRIRSVGVIAANGVQRTAEVIVGPPSLAPPWANLNFNAPQQTTACVPPACTPTGWTLAANPNTYIPWDDTGGPDGSRAALVYKSIPGPSTATSAGSYAFSPPFTVTGPVVLTIAFDYRVEMLGPGGAPNEMGLQFGLNQVAPSALVLSSTAFQSAKTAGFVHASVTVSVTSGGTVAIGALSFALTAKAGQPEKIWLDNIAITAPGQQPGSQITDWREVLP